MAEHDGRAAESKPHASDEATMCHVIQPRSLILLGRTVRPPFFTATGQSLSACARTWPRCRATDQARPEIANSFFRCAHVTCPGSLTPQQDGLSQTVQGHGLSPWAPQHANVSQRALEGVNVEARCVGRGGNTKMHPYYAQYYHW